MSTLTDNRGLIKPTLTDQIQQTISDISDTLDILDLTSIISCTSGSRPTGVSGMVIWETDTTRVLVFDGSIWRVFWRFGWITYTPTWTTSGSSPTLGNGTLSGAYKVVGNSVECRIYLQTGSTTNLGTGVWSFALPVAPINGVRQALSGAIIDGGGSLTERWPVTGLIASNAGLLVDRLIVSENTLGSSTPQAWATSTTLTLTGVYEAN